jgi:phosphoribosylamine--glycine ligase
MPNLDIINLSPDHYVFHAGTKKQNGNWVSNGGRVLAVSSLGETINKARDNVYSTIDQIEWKDGYYRKDIGYRYAK